MVAEQPQRMGQGASTRQGAAEPGVVPCEGAPGELLQIDVTYPGLRLLHRDPPVWWVDGFLTDAECDVRAPDPPRRTPSPRRAGG